MGSLLTLVFVLVFNFVLFRVEGERLDHRGVFERLLGGHGVLVRDVSAYPMLEGCLRVNPGTPEETTVFLEAMAGIMEGGDR